MHNGRASSTNGRWDAGVRGKVSRGMTSRAQGHRWLAAMAARVSSVEPRTPGRERTTGGLVARHGRTTELSTGEFLLRSAMTGEKVGREGERSGFSPAHEARPLHGLLGSSPRDPTARNEGKLRGRSSSSCTEQER